MPAGEAQQAVGTKTEASVEGQGAAVLDADCQLQTLGARRRRQRSQNMDQRRTDPLIARLFGDHQIGYFGNGVSIADELGSGDGPFVRASHRQDVEEPPLLLLLHAAHKARGELLQWLFRKAGAVQGAYVSPGRQPEMYRWKMKIRRAQ